MVPHQPDHLDATLLEFGPHFGDPAELGGADGRKVRRVREENGPAVAYELVEVDVAHCRFSLEIRRCGPISAKNKRDSDS
jgi:hypothetical protein